MLKLANASAGFWRFKGSHNSNNFDVRATEIPPENSHLRRKTKA